MPHLGFHPATGFGELLPGWFVVPQNPLRTKLSGVGYVPHIGELMPGAFVVPENPIRRALLASTPVMAKGTVDAAAAAQGGSGMPGMGDCGCGGCGCGTCGMSGLGDIFGVSTPIFLLLAAGGVWYAKKQHWF